MAISLGYMLDVWAFTWSCTLWATWGCALCNRMMPSVRLVT